MITRAQLLAIAPAVGSRADIFIGPINKTAERFQVNTRRRLAEFLAQVLHESGNFQFMAENLNYTPEALLATFNTPNVARFTKTDAYRYGRTMEHPADQVTIANIAYCRRMGNGPMESGDGWRYRARGPGQLTGKANFERCGAVLGLDLISRPELVEQPETGMLAFGWYWAGGNARGLNLNTYADAGDIDTISDVINIGRPTPRYGDAIGFKERKALRDRCLEVLI